MNKAYTLLEVVIALALWLILSTGIFLVWQHSALSGAHLLEQQNAFENARLSMDALIINFQLARKITLQTDSNNVLQLLTLNQRNPLGIFEDYVFRFNVNASPASAQYQRLEFGNNEFAANIAEIKIIYIDGNHMDITVTTGCDEPIVLHGSVDVSYKDVTVIGGG